MLIRSHDNGFQHPQGSEITPRASYLQRRAWLQYLAAGSAGAALPGWAAGVQRPGKLAALASVPSQVPGANSMERVTAYADASQYNNFYEFGLDKDDPAKNAHTLKTRPWTVKIEGLVQQPQTLDLDALLKLAPLEERIYRLRCVEGWSMVIPWVGYSLAELLRKVQPLGSAKYVEFVTLADKAQMPGLRSGVLDWPYTEGLRLDEAMHPLTLLAFGMYGEVLPNQNGAPVRLQERQEHRRHPPDRQGAGHGLEQGGAQRVRLLFQCEPGRAAPALEPGHGAAHWRGWPVRQEAQDAAVQRLRSPGRPALHGHGSEEVLLMRPMQ